MGLRTLSETIILQSIEDLFSQKEREGSIRFFRGKGFKIAADIAGMKFEERQKLRKMLTGFLEEGTR